MQRKNDCRNAFHRLPQHHHPVEKTYDEGMTPPIVLMTETRDPVRVRDETYAGLVVSPPRVGMQDSLGFELDHRLQHIHPLQLLQL